MKNILLSIWLLVIACSPKSTFDKEKAIAEIMELHDEQQSVHLKEDPEAFAGLLSERFVSVNRGRISRPTREENIQRFSSYFNAIEFEKWDDLSVPVISFSDDGSMAYSIVHKEVILSYQDKNDEDIRERTEFAWLAIYRKTQEGWTIESIASTNLPTETLSDPESN